MISSRHFTRKESGFTLVELLVVILIIGILAAVAIPAFMNQRKKANTAALETDLKNVATAYHSWTSNPNNDNEKFWDIIGSRAIYIQHPEGQNGAPSGIKRWHNVPELPDVPVSPGTVIELFVNDEATNGWQRVHETGEFCLIGQMRNSDYDYVPYSGMGASAFDRNLFFDSKQGGIKTIDELVEAIQNGEEISCDGNVRRYMAAVGL